MRTAPTKTCLSPVDFKINYTHRVTLPRGEIISTAIASHASLITKYQARVALFGRRSKSHTVDINRAVPSGRSVANPKGSQSLPRRPRFSHYRALCCSSEGALQPPRGRVNLPGLGWQGGRENNYSGRRCLFRRRGLETPRRPSYIPVPFAQPGAGR